MGEKIDRAKLLSVKWRANPSELTEVQRQLIELRLQGLGFAEISQRLNLPEESLREIEAELLARVPPPD
jgi:DNA-binding CsgD family transcriptional regulator